MASSLDLLIRNSTYDELIRAVNTCVLPAGANLIQITKGCLCLKVQLMDLSALETLWRLYKDGTLKASLQALFDTDEIREFAGGEHVEVIVTIDEREYNKARSELGNEAHGYLYITQISSLIICLLQESIPLSQQLLYIHLFHGLFLCTFKALFPGFIISFYSATTLTRDT